MDFFTYNDGLQKYLKFIIKKCATSNRAVFREWEREVFNGGQQKLDLLDTVRAWRVLLNPTMVSIYGFYEILFIIECEMFVAGATKAGSITGYDCALWLQSP